ncbi:MAG: alpha/beta hydrolase [Bryobacteraceae bacterium]
MRGPVIPLLLLGAALFAQTSAAAVVTRDVEFVRRGNTPILLDASVPDGPGPFPTVILVHGGGFTQGSKTMYITPMFQPLTSGNFTWFSINYRLVPEVDLQGQVDDVLSAIQWVHDHAREYKVDPKRIALLGESAGAFLVDYAAIVAAKDLRVAAVVSFYGPHDLVLQSKEKGFSKGLRSLTGVQELNAEGEKRLRAVSPYYMVKNGLPPFLLLHGTADELVPYQQSPRFCDALKAKGGDCELYTVPGGQHGVGNWEKHPDQLEYKSVVIAWLKKKLQ